MVEAYRALLWPAAPLAAAWLAVNKARRPQLQRFRPGVPPEMGPHPVWVHACSVGEVTTAMPLLKVLQARWPQRRIVLTVSTQTGYALARDRAPIPVTWFPLDHPLSVADFFERVRPASLLLVETELWPGVLARAHALGVPVALVSGRLSDAHARGYARSRGLWRGVLRPLAAAAMQSQTYADRLVDLGVDPARIRVTGNIKYDATPPKLSADERIGLRAALGIAPDAPVIVFGSTHAGDETLGVACWRALRSGFPRLRIMVAPRHLDRVDEVQRALACTPVVRRSELIGPAADDDRIILLDTHGELRRMYGMADVAVVCGSIYPGVDGHNPLEPAAHGVATVFGPHMRNFADIAERLLAAGGSEQVSSAEELPQRLDVLLRDRSRCARVGAAGEAVAAAERGALARTLDFIAPVIDSRPGV